MEHNELRGGCDRSWALTWWLQWTWASLLRAFVHIRCSGIARSWRLPGPRDLSAASHRAASGSSPGRRFAVTLYSRTENGRGFRAARRGVFSGQRRCFGAACSLARWTFRLWNSFPPSSSLRGSLRRGAVDAQPFALGGCTSGLRLAAVRAGGSGCWAWFFQRWLLRGFPPVCHRC